MCALIRHEEYKSMFVLNKSHLSFTINKKHSFLFCFRTAACLFGVYSFQIMRKVFTLHVSFPVLISGLKFECPGTDG